MISERNQRRLAKRQLKSQATRIKAGRVAPLPDRPDVEEVFRLDDDGTGNAMFFDVLAMRTWARERLEPLNLMIEQWRAD